MTRIYGGVAETDRRAERRRKLVEAAYNVLADGGTGALTVTRVCKEAGLSPRYFYEHFENREQLLTAILEVEADTVIAYIADTAMNAAGTPHERAEAGMDALLHALEADPRRAELGRATLHDDTLLRFRTTVTARMADHLAGILEQLLGPSRDPERIRIASSLTAVGIIQIVIDWLAGSISVDRSELVRIAVRYAESTFALFTDPDDASIVALLVEANLPQDRKTLTTSPGDGDTP